MLYPSKALYRNKYIKIKHLHWHYSDAPVDTVAVVVGPFD